MTSPATMTPTATQWEAQDMRTDEYPTTLQTTKTIPDRIPKQQAANSKAQHRLANQRSSPLLSDIKASRRTSEKSTAVTLQEMDHQNGGLWTTYLCKHYGQEQKANLLLGHVSTADYLQAISVTEDQL